jgi:hypothetical protein
MNNDITIKAIAANFEALGELLDIATQRVTEALLAANQNEQNQAIGSMIDLDQHLEHALALYRACIALHRAGRT